MLRLAHRIHSTARRALVMAALYEELGFDAEALSAYEQALSLDPDDLNAPRAIARLRSRGPHPPCPKCALMRNWECQPQDCPDLPFGWHRRDGEHEVLGSGLEGSSRERVFACFGEPAEFSSDTWMYWQGKCIQTSAQADPNTSTHSVLNSVRLHFDGDIVDRVTHERTIGAHGCGRLLTTY
jgi:hypothetical protein